ncbi:DUF1829 domain-containing protein [Bacillus thermocopriae]|uniref:DUF1829 domain-containing protein n=1 Tax=Neobacillus thermocopriae TaxID=1215031 RepID=A0A6B3TME7_9BACI|nr:DUF1829 domain-containing protein [Neobacillus thermocopriae]NEX77410.1 DUF1829 domain-containing protein [Neobacillus thermocopriae]
MQIINELKNAYSNWINEQLQFRDLNGAIEITTPFLDRNNDRIQLYVIQDETGLKITDDGITLNELQMSGIDVFDSPRRIELLNFILNGYGVKSNKEELFVNATKSNFPQKKHSLIQAVMSVNDMFMTSRETVTGIFLEDVKEFLDSKDVRFTPNVSFSGKSGLVHHFDFVIPKFKDAPERVLKTFNNPSKEKTEAMLFAWADTKMTRDENSVLYAFLNDTDRKINDSILNALQEYSVKPVLWSEREKYAKELAA